ncbi:hypothetical protein B5C02_04240 [Staphylococcus pseudintermedius]|nr:hypothetical protein B5C02_04240 [Staphylococcus pseudintermedius]
MDFRQCVEGPTPRKAMMSISNHKLWVWLVQQTYCINSIKIFLYPIPIKFLYQTQSLLLNDWVLINVANKKETGYGFLTLNLFPFCMMPY